MDGTSKNWNSRHARLPQKKCGLVRARNRYNRDCQVEQDTHFVCSRSSGYHSVIPAKAGIQYLGVGSGSPFHSARNDGGDLA